MQWRLSIFVGTLQRASRTHQTLDHIVVTMPRTTEESCVPVLRGEKKREGEEGVIRREERGEWSVKRGRSEGVGRSEE